MTVNSPALYLLAPISDSWVFEIGAVYDSMTGASPYYHTVLSGASGEGVEDKRLAGDITVTKYFGRGRPCAVHTRLKTTTSRSLEDSRCATRHRIRTPRLRSASATHPTKFSARRAGFHAQQKYARWHRWHYAGTEPQRRRASESVLRAPERLSDRPVQGHFRSRPAARQSRSVGFVGPLESLLPKLERYVAVVVSLLPRRLGGQRQHGHGRMGAGVAAGLHVDAERALYDSKRGLLLLRSGLRRDAGCAFPARDMRAIRTPFTPATSDCPHSAESRSA